MSKTMAFPEGVKAELLRISTAGAFVRAQEILARGNPEELVLESAEEAQILVNVARVELMKTILHCPFWDEDDPRHDPTHAERFHEVVNGLFEKTISYIAQDFEVVTTI